MTVNFVPCSYGIVCGMINVLQNSVSVGPARAQDLSHASPMLKKLSQPVGGCDCSCSVRTLNLKNTPTTEATKEKPYPTISLPHTCWMIVGWPLSVHAHGLVQALAAEPSVLYLFFTLAYLKDPTAAIGLSHREIYQTRYLKKF